MEHTRFVGLDNHKERISIAVAESGRSGAVEYLGEISNDPVAIGKLCDRLGRSSKTSWFMSMTDAVDRLEEWRCHYNNDRPHTSLGNLTPTSSYAKLKQPEKLPSTWTTKWRSSNARKNCSQR